MKSSVINFDKNSIDLVDVNQSNELDKNIDLQDIEQTNIEHKNQTYIEFN